MKKSFFRPHPSALTLMACGGGMAGLALRYWVDASAAASNGLLPPFHIGWVGLWLLTAAMGVLLMLGVGTLRGPASAAKSFPASMPAAIGCIPMVIVCLRSMNAGILPMALAILTAVAFLLVALCRLSGKQPPFLCYVVICVWLALELLSLYQAWSFRPGLHHYGFHLLATIALTLTACHLAGFGAGKVRHRRLWFWGLAAGFLCLTCADDGFFYAAGAAWVLTNLSLVRRPQPPKQEA